LRVCLRAGSIPVDPVRPSMAIYYDSEYHDRGIDVEAALPILGSAPGTPRVEVHSLPAVEIMACAVHQGSYELLTGAYEAIMGWIESNGYRVSGPCRDVYLQGPESGIDPAEYVTEVQFPLSKEPVSSFVMQAKEKNAMEPKIITKAEFTVVGMRYYGKNENNEIAQVWREFMPRIGEIKHQRAVEIGYGVCRDMTEDGEFEYVAGIEVVRAEDIPEGMVSCTVPLQKYAVFTCTLPTIGAAYEYALRTWLPESGYRRACGPDYELYDESFDSQNKDSELFVYIPIE
jgi:predicted transcriptional regulator YdeE